jgi:signal peptidase II
MSFYLTAGAVVLLDLATKALVVGGLHLGDSVPVIPGLFNIVFVLNPGAAFGFLAGLPPDLRRPFFIVISLAAIALIVVYRMRYLADKRLASLALALILGGALGNLIDRLRYGMVVDFLDLYLGSYHWPAFNVADSAISVGVGLMLLEMVLEWRRERSGRGAA